MSDPAAQPSRLTLIRWIQTNVALTTFIFALMSALAGAIWSGGGWVSDQTAQFARVDAVDAGLRHAVDSGHDAIVDIDRRLNDITLSRADARRQIEREMADLASRVLILETQLKFVGDRVQQGPRR